MEFARRGRGDEDIDDMHRFIDLPPPHVDPMLVIREALLSQLQKDRLRQEIIQAELAKIEHAMVLRNSSRHGIAADNVEWTKPVPFNFREQSMPPWRWSVSQECYVDVDEIHDRKQKEGRHRSVELKSEKPAMEDGECLRPCCNGKASQENSKVEEQKSQESSETIQPKTTLPSVKWELTGITIPVKKKKRHQKLSCEICQVQATSEHNLQEHRAGRKHQSKEAINQKVQLTEESFSCKEQKTSSIKWSCSTCQANGTSKSDLKEHLNGRTHRQNIKPQLMESDGMAKNNELQEPECPKNNAPQHSEKPPPMWSSTTCLANSIHESELGGHLLAKLQVLDEISNMSRISESREARVLPNVAPRHAEQIPGSNCSILQADSDCQLDLEHQIGGKIHQLNAQDLREEAKKTGDFPPEIAKDQQPPSEWGCVICQAKFYSVSQFVHHSRGKKHQKKTEALQGGVNAKSSNLTTEHEVASNGSDSNSLSSEKVEDQTALWLCGICNLQCSSESMLAGHCEEEEHMEKQKLLEFCEVCNLQCNSEKMLAHHLSGNKHQKRLNAKKQNALVACLPVGSADHIVAADVDNDLKEKKDGVRVGVELESQKPATDDLVRECLKTSCGAGNAADQQNAALDESKLQEPNESTLPKKTTSSPLKWSCDICWVEGPTEDHLQQNCAGQKHESKVAALVSRNNGSGHNAKAAAASSGNVRQYDEKPHPTWVCRFCQSNCTCKSDLENHLRGKRHKAQIQCLLEECKNMAVIYGSPNSEPNLATQEEDNNPASAWNCSLCQAKCTCQSDLANHLRGKRHQLNFLVLQVEGKQYLSEWGCGICQAKCNSVSQLESHWSSRGHQQKVEALRGGGQIASSEDTETRRKT